MFGTMKTNITREIEEIKKGGLYKAERIITSPQRMNITVEPGREVLNMCANNYLGLSDNPAVIQAAKDSFDKWGYGLSSVRFICGTQRLHKELERKIAEFLDTEDTILYCSCFDANGGLFETLLTAEDAIIAVYKSLPPVTYIMPVDFQKSYHQPHLENFFDAIRGKAKLTCPAQVGFESAAVVLKVNQAVEAGRRLDFTEADFKA